MATLYITELQNLGSAANNFTVEVAYWQPLAEQTVAIGGSSTQSNAFNSATRYIRVHTDSICSIETGSTNPTATATTARMVAGQTEYLGVNPGGGWKIAVITNS